MEKSEKNLAQDSIISKSESETIALGSQFAAKLEAGAVIALSGELGSGKTHFVKGIAKGLGFLDEVTSPTFTLVHEYRGGRLPIWHVDWYRIKSVEEAFRLGLEEVWQEGVTVMEWPEKAEAFLPPNTQWLKIKTRDENEREIFGIK